jgi:hypothetical protein
MIELNANVLKVLEESTCFGICYDIEMPECKMCDVKVQCKAKTEGANIPTPMVKEKKSTPAPKPDKPKQAPKKESTAKKQAEKKATANASKPSPKKPAPAKKAPSGNVPDFKDVKLDELREIAKKEGVEYKEYGNDNITRMRLVMALKKHYS